VLWDFICRDTYAQSHLNKTSQRAGHAAELAQRQKIGHHSNRADHFVFIPVTVEALDVFGKSGIDFIKKVGSKITEATNEKRATE